MESELRSFVFDRKYAVPASAVYAALTDVPRLWSTLDPVSVHSDLNVGGSYRVELHTITLTGKFCALDPDVHILMTLYLELERESLPCEFYLEFLLQPFTQNETNLLMSFSASSNVPENLLKELKPFAMIWLDALDVALQPSFTPDVRFAAGFRDIVFFSLVSFVVVGSIVNQLSSTHTVNTILCMAGFWFLVSIGFAARCYLPGFKYSLRQLYVAVLTLQLPMAMVLLPASTETRVFGGVLFVIWLIALFAYIRFQTSGLHTESKVMVRKD